jgi:hypothetical protein
VTTTTKPKAQMSERTAAAIGKGIAEGKARLLRGEVIGPWRGQPEEMLPAILHDDEQERERLAAIAYHSACRRWAELVLLRASAVRASAMVLGDGDTAVGIRLLDGLFAWPGDKVEWIDPVTGNVDGVPWLVKDVWAEGAMLERHAGMLPLFGERCTRRMVSAVGMSRLALWRWS